LLYFVIMILQQSLPARAWSWFCSFTFPQGLVARSQVNEYSPLCYVCICALTISYWSVQIQAPRKFTGDSISGTRTELAIDYLMVLLVWGISRASKLLLLILGNTHCSVLSFSEIWASFTFCVISPVYYMCTFVQFAKHAI
jgi:hypothetical protein